MDKYPNKIKGLSDEDVDANEARRPSDLGYESMYKSGGEEDHTNLSGNVMLEYRAKGSSMGDYQRSEKQDRTGQ